MKNLSLKENGVAGFPEDISWEDRGADITIIAFSGMALRYSGMPQFEFRKILSSNGMRYNHIFVRDICRNFYFNSPQGDNNGIGYYQKLVEEAISHLPPSFNVALGLSGGGTAGFLLCNGLPIHHILSFNPIFSLDMYASEKIIRLSLQALRQGTDLMSRFEPIYTLLANRVHWKRLCKAMGSQNIPNVTQRYLSTQPQPPSASIYYSQYNPPDARQAMLLDGIPRVILKPVNSLQHNCAKKLREKGKLAPLIQQDIHDAYMAWRQGSHGNISEL